MDREIILDVIRRVLQAAAAFLSEQLAILGDRLWHDGEYREGFAAALLLGLIVGFVSRQYLKWRKQVQEFFRPPVFVLQSRGPTPYQSYQSCLMGAFKMAFFAILLLILVLAMVSNRLAS
jgi:hypothetical protein